jgi:hypothetical protein
MSRSARHSSSSYMMSDLICLSMILSKMVGAPLSAWLHGGRGVVADTRRECKHGDMRRPAAWDVELKLPCGRIAAGGGVLRAWGAGAAARPHGPTHAAAACAARSSEDIPLAATRRGTRLMLSAKPDLNVGARRSAESIG